MVLVCSYVCSLVPYGFLIIIFVINFVCPSALRKSPRNGQKPLWSRPGAGQTINQLRPSLLPRLLPPRLCLGSVFSFLRAVVSAGCSAVSAASSSAAACREADSLGGQMRRDDVSPLAAGAGGGVSSSSPFPLASTTRRLFVDAVPAPSAAGRPSPPTGRRSRTTPRGRR